jgi:hypothetical protein
MKKKTYDLIGAGKEVGLKVKIEETKHTLISRLQNVG